jgi:hypothetical protein
MYLGGRAARLGPAETRNGDFYKESRCRDIESIIEIEGIEGTEHRECVL